MNIVHFCETFFAVQKNYISIIWHIMPKKFNLKQLFFVKNCIKIDMKTRNSNKDEKCQKFQN